MDGITNIPANGPLYTSFHASNVIRQQTMANHDLSNVKTDSTPLSPELIKELREELAALPPGFNQRLEFKYNQELGQVIVKVIDRETDKLIKELPPTEFQHRVRIAIREAIGLLVDKKV